MTSPAWATMTQVGSITTKDCTPALLTCSVAYTLHAAGDQITVKGTMIDAVNATITSVTDDATGGSSTYTCDINKKFTGSHIGFVCTTCSAKAGLANISINIATASLGAFVVTEFAGNLGTSPCSDGITASTKTASGTATTSNALTPTVAGDVSIGALDQTTNSTSTWTGTSGYSCTNRSEVTDGDVTASCYSILTGTASQTVTATFSSSNTWFADQVLYKPAAATAKSMPPAVY